MAISTDVQKETLAQAYASEAVVASLHVSSPGTTGAGELTGGTYARQNISWTAGATDGLVVGTATFAVPAGSDVTHVGLWAADNTTFLDSTVSNTLFGSDSDYTVTLTYTQT